jgi:hypothetical protein
LNDNVAGITKLGKTQSECFIVYRLISDKLQFVNIFSPNKVATLFSVDLLRLLNCIIETIQVTERRMLVSSDVKYENKMRKKKKRTDSYSSAVKTGLLTWSMLLRVSYYTFNYAGNTNCLNIPYISLSQHKKIRGAQIKTVKLLTN